jgi:uncharacterized PurR-regulated membrane protein YhhQ (DUF165 family)
MNRKRTCIAVAASVIYLASVILANWLTTQFGFIDVGFGNAATAGTFAAGGALVVRDLVQDSLGRLGVATLIVVGAALSWLVATPAIALASGVAFLVAEALDMALYTPLRARGQFGGPWWSRAVLIGAAAGAVVDTILFLTIAFGWNAVGSGLPGQLLAKGEVVLILIVLGVTTGAVLREPLNARRA